MQLNKSHEIERAVSPDTTRPHLANAWLDCEAKKLIATDGHMMVAVPVTGLDSSPGDHPQDETGYVSPAALKQARKATPKGEPVTLGANGCHSFIGGATMPRPNVKTAFPPWEQVLPSYRKGDEDTITIGFSATLLVELLKAIGKGKAGEEIALTFPIPKAGRAMLDPYVIEGTDGAIGVLMPCRP